MAFTYLAAKLGTGFRDSNGDPVRGYVTLTPSAAMHNGSIVSGETRYAVEDDGTLWTIERDGQLGVPALVAANDDAATTPQGVAYRVEISSNNSTESPTYYVVVPAASAGGVVDLDALAPLGIAPPLFGTGGGASVTDATSNVKGVLRLTGDLSGTAASPTVPGLGGKAASVHTHAQADVTGLAAALAAAGLQLPNLPSGSWFTPIATGSGNNSVPNNGQLNLAPWLVTRTISLDRIGISVGTAGTGASKIRVVIYADNGSCYPGALLVDSGQLDSSTTGSKNATIAKTLTPGLYWTGGVPQGNIGGEPVVSMLTSASLWTPPVPLTVNAQSTLPGGIAYRQTGITGALPDPFASVASTDTQNLAVRVQLRVA